PTSTYCAARLCPQATGLRLLHHYRARRDRHAFPTRRSSDLLLGESGDGRAERAGEGTAELAEAATLPFRFSRMGPKGGGKQLGEDRKSTRLNSSHQIISYAVFCLKKKMSSDSMSIAP